MSFSFAVIDEIWQKVDKEDIRTLQELELFDVSVVAFPAYEDTDVAQRRLKDYQDAANWTKTPVKVNFTFRQRQAESE